MGSAVLVELEHRDEPRGVRRYLLTCAHVVRQKGMEPDQWWGPVYGEILCWQRGQGYTRTYRGRRCGHHPDIFGATVSALSPCGGNPEVLPPELRHGPHDWVLLDIADPKFQIEGRPLRWAEIAEGSRVYIVGYPGGAGLTTRPMNRRWTNGSIVDNVVTGPFSQMRAPEAGMLSLEGVDEARPGMSGGGIFDADGALSGLHRSSDESAMQRNAVSIAHIRDALDTRRNVSPTTPISKGRVSPWLQRGLTVLALIAAVAAGIYVLARGSTCSLGVEYRFGAFGEPAAVVDVIRHNGMADSTVPASDGSASIILKKMKPSESWSLGLRFHDAATRRIDVSGCPTEPVRFDFPENAHVILTPQ
ncbi:MAG: S1 family peptidase [Pseudomarimonas sp.]